MITSQVLFLYKLPTKVSKHIYFKQFISYYKKNCNLELNHSKLLELDVEFWTAGRRSLNCPEKTEWCSSKFNYFLRENLNWVDGKNDDDPFKSCVSLKLENRFNAVETKLDMADCAKKIPILCEVKILNILCNPGL